ncbi:hypothetical protein BD408DRAFT_423438 [Parasitella parasitica]|nr:hypothetical protein BD408DRAFT_423438 [Parasitella parasitica]
MYMGAYTCPAAFGHSQSFKYSLSRELILQHMIYVYVEWLKFEGILARPSVNYGHGRMLICPSSALVLIIGAYIAHATRKRLEERDERE